MFGQGMGLMGGLSARGAAFLPTADQMRGMAAPFSSAETAQEAHVAREGILTSETPIEIRLGFIRKVYGIVLSQLTLTAAVGFTVFKSVDGSWVRSNTWVLALSVAMCFASLFAIMCFGARARKFPHNYALLYLFTTFAALTLGFLSTTVNSGSVVMAVVITALVVLLLTVYACNTRRSFAGYMPYVFAAFSILGTFGFALWMMSWCFGLNFPWFVVLYNMAGVALFTFYIVFDTQRIMGEWGGHAICFGIDEYAFAALSLYIDIINLFMHLLSLIRYFAQRRG
jgi:FtsH-binding integral membrane protein